MKLYCCVGCREIHYDNDYDESDGDLLIVDWKRTLKSIDRVKKELRETEGERNG